MGDQNRPGLRGRLLRGRDRLRPDRESRHRAAFVERLHSWFAVHRPQVSILAMSDPSHTVLKVEKQELLVDFGGLYAWFKRAPEALHRVLGEFVEEVVQELGNRSMPLFEDVIDRLHPQVRSFAFLEENSPRFGLGRLVRLALGGDLHLLFVMDEGRGMTFVNQGHLQSWSVQVQALANLALRNLAGQPLPVRAGCRLFDPGGYAAAHLVILDRLLEGAGGGEFLVGVPHRDALIVEPADLDPRDREALALEVQRLHRNASRPVAPELHHCRCLPGGGVQVRPWRQGSVSGARAPVRSK